MCCSRCCTSTGWTWPAIGRVSAPTPWPTRHSWKPWSRRAWPRDPAWRTSLQQIIAAVSPAAPEPARKDLARLAGFDAGRIEALAERVLHTELYGEDAALLPYVAAALQVLWTAGAARLGEAGPPEKVRAAGNVAAVEVVACVGSISALFFGR